MAPADLTADTEDHISVVPLGAGLGVGRSCLLLTVRGQTVMLDCGMHVGYSDHRRFPDFTPLLRGGGRLEGRIACVLVTHFHLDHCAALPYFTEQVGYDGPVLMTSPTRAVCPELLLDYQRVMSNKLGAKRMYTKEMIRACMRKVVTVGLGVPFRVAGLEITPYYAGHVLGAACFRIRWVGGGVERSVLYTGDYNMTADRHLGAARVPCLRPDLLITESTFATTIRGSKRSREMDFLQAVDQCIRAGGKVLIPVFAVGRIQELCLLLEEFWAQQDIRCPIYISGGLAGQAHRFYRLFLDWTHPSLVRAFTAERRNALNFRYTREFSEKHIHAPGPMVVFASPGMLNGGMSLRLFAHWAPDERNLLILPGHCVTGTVGARVMRGEAEVDVAAAGEPPRPVRVACRAAHMSFSAHTDLKGILQMVTRVRPSAVVLVHGQPKNIRSLQEKLRTELKLPAYAPRNMERIRIPLPPAMVPMAASSELLADIQAQPSPAAARRGPNKRRRETRGAAIGCGGPGTRAKALRARPRNSRVVEGICIEGITELDGKAGQKPLLTTRKDVEEKLALVRSHVEFVSKSRYKLNGSAALSGLGLREIGPQLQSMLSSAFSNRNVELLKNTEKCGREGAIHCKDEKKEASDKEDFSWLIRLHSLSVENEDASVSMSLGIDRGEGSGNEGNEKNKEPDCDVCIELRWGHAFATLGEQVEEFLENRVFGDNLQESGSTSGLNTEGKKKGTDDQGGNSSA